MWKFFKKRELEKKGLSCGKTRRRSSRLAWVDSLNYHPMGRFGIYALFLAGLAGLIFTRSLPQPTHAFMIGLLGFFLASIHLSIGGLAGAKSNGRILLVFVVIFAQLIVVKLIATFFAPANYPLEWQLSAIPYALAPLTLSVLLGSGYGIFASIYTSLWAALLIPSENAFSAFAVGLLASFLGVFATRQVRRRGRLLHAGFLVGAATLLVSFLLGQMAPIDFLVPALTPWPVIGGQALCILAIGLFTAMIVGGVLPLLEGLFGVTTDISWLELSDLNHPLLKRMTIEAPGTYHHSLVVANLAEAGAEAIGANATMSRVCAYFHDIGKLVKPGYFVENIATGRNPHDDLTPTMSALIITAHVKEGVELAFKNRLNERIIDVIEQHHGTSLVYYFYHRAKEQQELMRTKVREAKAKEEDIPEVKKENFRYPGPKPQFKESAVISLADAVESASRSLSKPTPQKIEQLIEEIFQARIQDGQLDECELTLRDLGTIKKRFKSTLVSMMHHRIAYPKEEKLKKKAPPAKVVEHAA